MEALVALALKAAPSILSLLLPKLLAGEQAATAAVKGAVVASTGTADPAAAAAKLQADAAAADDLRLRLAKIAADEQASRDRSDTALVQGQTAQITAAITAQTDQLKARLADVANARTARNGATSKTASWLAVLTNAELVASMAILSALAYFSHSIEAGVFTAVMTVLGTIVGNLISQSNNVNGFYFGSSTGSETHAGVNADTTKTLLGALVAAVPPATVGTLPPKLPPLVVGTKPPETTTAGPQSPAGAPETPATETHPSSTEPSPAGNVVAAGGLPPWFVAALHEVGNTSASLERYIGMAGFGAVGDAWCAIFLGAMLKSSGFPNSGSPAALSYTTTSHVVPLSGPALGCIAVFWRISKSSGLGHVCFYAGERGDLIWGVGGNEGHIVQNEALPRASKAFGLIGYYWPAGHPLPTVGPVILPASTPAHEVTASAAEAELAKVTAAADGTAPATTAAPAVPVPVHLSPQITKLVAANENRWEAMHVSASRLPAFDATAKRLVGSKARYETISAATATAANPKGVPWHVIAVIHEREASGDFTKQLAQGDPLGAVSTHEPAGLGPFHDHADDPPGQDAFYRAALVALIDAAPHAARWTDWTAGGTMTILEEYNGLGYANRGVPSAYVWSGTDQYVSGKFVADHVYRASAVDVQEGCAPLIARMMAIDPTIKFASAA